MKKVLAAAALVALSASSALAAGPYVGASAGVAFIHDSDITFTGSSQKLTAEYKAAPSLTLSAGYQMDGGGRLELEYGYKTASVKAVRFHGQSLTVSDSDISVNSFMLNGYYDVVTDSKIAPFFGAGVGVLRGEFKDSSDKMHATAFGYQGTAGLAIKVDPKCFLDLSYRLQGAANDFEKDGTNISYLSSTISAGIRYNF